MIPGKVGRADNGPRADRLQVIAVERDVEGAAWHLHLFALVDGADDAVRELYAAALDADDDQAVGSIIQLDDLFGHSAERPVHRTCIEQRRIVSCHALDTFGFTCQRVSRSRFQIVWRFVQAAGALRVQSRWRRTVIDLVRLSKANRGGFQIELNDNGVPAPHLRHADFHYLHALHPRQVRSFTGPCATAGEVVRKRTVSQTSQGHHVFLQASCGALSSRCSWKLAPCTFPVPRIKHKRQDDPQQKRRFGVSSVITLSPLTKFELPGTGLSLVSVCATLLRRLVRTE